MVPSETREDGHGISHETNHGPGLKEKSRIDFLESGGGWLGTFFPQVRSHGGWARGHSRRDGGRNKLEIREGLYEMAFTAHHSYSPFGLLDVTLSSLGSNDDTHVIFGDPEQGSNSLLVQYQDG